MTAALVLTVGALALAGCGGSSGGTGTTGGGGQLTAQAWAAQIKGLFNQLKTVTQAVRTQGTNPQSWFTLSSKIKQIDSQVAALKPPAKLAGLNSAIASGLTPLSGEATSIGNDVKNNDKVAAQKDALSFLRSLAALLTKMSGALLKAGGSGTTT